MAFLGAYGKPTAEGATGRLWVEDDELNPVDVTEGRAPAAEGEVAVDRGTAEDEDLGIGDRVTVLTQAGRFPATVVGITRFGEGDALDGSGTVSIPRAAAFRWLSSSAPGFQSLSLRGSVPAEDLLREVTPLVPAGFEAQTGEAFRADQRDSIGAIGRVLKQGLQAFALLALLVGAFVIYNTFSVIVAQRVRELAVLAAIGATPRQIRRSLRWEGVVVGVIGSLLGVVVGLGLAFAVIAALGALGVALPGSGISVQPGNVVTGVLIGTVLTVLSVMIPARRAARTEPIEALRDASVEQVRVSRRRMVVAAVLGVLGVLGLLAGTNAPVVGLGVILLVAAVLVAGPAIALGGARLLTPLMSRLGMEGRLAADNTRRNPKRTATTANALLIGVFLVTFVTVSGTSLKDFIVGELKQVESADYLVVSDGGTLDERFVADLAGIEGVTQVVPFRRAPVTVDGRAERLATVDTGALTEVADVKVAQGSLDGLRDGTIALMGDEDGRVSGVAVGDRVAVVGASGQRADLEVVALLRRSIDSAQVGSLVDAATFARIAGPTSPTVAFIDVESGAQSDTKDAIDEQAALRPDVSVTEGNAVGRLVGSVFDFIIKAVDGLLLMSVIIALIGIINTLSLSILERRRELGLLRVVGMTDRRVQRMVRLESILIALLGTVSGLVLGTFVGWALIRTIDRLSEAGIGFSPPLRALLLVLVAGVLLGFLASLIPARRSTRLEVLDAIKAT